MPNLARPLPPLNALRAFEAAARHLSFTKAAAELNVTQGAISHQVQALEERLGVVFFHRFNRRLVLTDAGRAYLPTISEAFDSIAQATRLLSEQQDKGPLRVSVMPSFAAKWLLPRLPRFRAKHPEIDVLLSSNLRPVDLLRDEADVAIRFGRGPYPLLQVTDLMGDEEFPVVSPSLLSESRPLRVPADLANFTLLHDEVGDMEGALDWTLWARHVGLTGVDMRRGPTFTDSSFVVLAAIAGQGVALARASLAIDDLAAGRLVRPFEERLPMRLRYWLLAAPAKTSWAKVQRFREWLLEEVAALPALPPCQQVCKPS